MKTHQGIAFKTILWISGIVLAVGGTGFLYLSNKVEKSLKETVLKDIQTETEKATQKIELGFKEEISKAVAFATAVEHASAPNETEMPSVSREYIVDLNRKYSFDNPASFGYWVEYEINGFDGRDADFTNGKGISSTDTGRFSIYWARAKDGSIELDTTAGPESDPDLKGEDWYMAGYNANAPVVVEPYWYEIHGQNVLMTSVTSPVHRGDKIIGIAGFDIGLTDIQNQLSKVSIFEKGKVRLISPDGLFMSSPKKEEMSKNKNDIEWGKQRKSYFEKASKGEVVFFEMEDKELGKTLEHIIPVSFDGRKDRLFYVHSYVPEKYAFASVAEFNRLLNLTGLFILVVLMVSLYILINKKIKSPISEIEKELNVLAAGNLESKIKTNYTGELYSMAKALLNMQKDWKERLTQEREVASVNLRIKEALDKNPVPVIIYEESKKSAFYNEAFKSILQKYNKELSFHGLPKETIDWNILPEKINNKVLDVSKETSLDLVFDDLFIKLVSSPVLDQENKISGYSLTLIDRTPEYLAEKKIEALLIKANSGEIHHRLDIKTENDFLKKLSSSINGLLSETEKAVSSVYDGLEKISKGDLKEGDSIDLKGVYGQMQSKLVETRSTLKELVSQIQNSAKNIENAASEVALGHDDLSRRTEMQAANLEETAASMEELTATVKQNAEHAQQASQLAQGAKEKALEGGKEVEKLVVSMKEIQSATEKMTNIISTIDGISFQTNILALNAAIEAARAGEAGRGFAVVASEVRALAQRSAEAAKEIKNLIGTSQEMVKEGHENAEKTHNEMNLVVNSVTKVTELMAEIAAASKEQSMGIEQVNLTLTQLDETTQQNAALVEESTAATQSMKQQISELMDKANQFDVGIKEEKNLLVKKEIFKQTVKKPINFEPKKEDVKVEKKENVIPKNELKKTEVKKQTQSSTKPNEKNRKNDLNDSGEWVEF